VFFTLLAVYAAFLTALLFGLRAFDPRMEGIFNFTLVHEHFLLEYAEELEVGPRLIFWMAGWEVFGRFPIFGVGLGNAGYFFPEFIHPFGWKLLEVRDLLFRSTELIHTKSLWVRLLAETGIVGAAFFTGWYLLAAFCSRALEKIRTGENALAMRTVGLAGVFILLALIFEGFSVDSFALPYLWVSMGILTAAFQHAFMQNRQLMW
jgi:O-antigen ligase